MKKQILSVAFIAMMIGSVSVGCGSQKNPESTDTAAMDSAQKAKMMKKQMQKDTATPAKTIMDTAKVH